MSFLSEVIDIAREEGMRFSLRRDLPGCWVARLERRHDGSHVAAAIEPTPSQALVQALREAGAL